MPGTVVPDFMNRRLSKTLIHESQIQVDKKKDIPVTDAKTQDSIRNIQSFSATIPQTYIFFFSPGH